MARSPPASPKSPACLACPRALPHCPACSRRARRNCSMSPTPSQLILLDEPTSGVSTAEKHTVMTTLIGAARAAGVQAIILVEHDMDLVAAYSHRIIALSEGRVLADLPPEKFFADPVIIETVVGK